MKKAKAVISPITIKVSAEFLSGLDDWRRKRSPIPSRSEAIRTLIANGLKK